MSWAVRVHRDDLVIFQADGTNGSAVCGLTDCKIEPKQATPRPVWNPDEKQTMNFYADWHRMPDNLPPENGFKTQWEMFIRHVAENAPYDFDLVAGARGVQLVECAQQSWNERRWVDVPALAV
jgi:predicted dehydrogenase